jgi:hypothetical protein
MGTPLTVCLGLFLVTLTEKRCVILRFIFMRLFNRMSITKFEQVCHQFMLKNVGSRMTSIQRLAPEHLTMHVSSLSLTFFP